MSTESAELSAQSSPAAVGVSTRLLEHGDVAAVHAIDRASYADPWPEHLLASEVDRADRCHVVATLDGELVGHASLLVVEPEATLTTVAVAPVHRGAAIATKLLVDLFGRAVDRDIDAITLEVRSRNLAAHALYRRFGFAPAGIRRGYYPAAGTEPADDALIMWAHDIGGADYQTRLATIAAAWPQPSSPNPVPLDTGEHSHD